MRKDRQPQPKNIKANPNVAFVTDDVPAPQDGAAGVRFLEIRGTAEPAVAADGHLAAEIIRIRPGACSPSTFCLIYFVTDGIWRFMSGSSGK